MSGAKPPKREFNPRSHAMIYLLAVIYLIYLIVQMVKEYLAGGPDAPSVPLLIGGVALLGGGCIFLGVLAHKMSSMSPKGEERADSGNGTDAEDGMKQEPEQKQESGKSQGFGTEEDAEK